MSSSNLKYENCEHVKQNPDLNFVSLVKVTDIKDHDDFKICEECFEEHYRDKLYICHVCSSYMTSKCIMISSDVFYCLKCLHIDPKSTISLSSSHQITGFDIQYDEIFTSKKEREMINMMITERTDQYVPFFLRQYRSNDYYKQSRNTYHILRITGMLSRRFKLRWTTCYEICRHLKTPIDIDHEDFKNNITLLTWLLNPHLKDDSPYKRPHRIDDNDDNDLSTKKQRS